MQDTAVVGMNETLAEHLMREAQRMEEELLQARSVQRYLLPKEVQEHPAFRTAYVYQPLHHIGGDFIDTLLRADGQLVLMIGDVSGHGMAAALSSAMLKTAFLRHAGTASGPGNLLTRIDRELSETVRFGRFVTAIVVWFDTVTRTVKVSSAGHPSPLLVRGGAVTTLHYEPELPLFTGEAVRYPDAYTETLRAGDRLLIMTDGILEAVRSNGEMLSPDDLDHAVSHCPMDGNFAACLFESLFFSDLIFRDDVTLLAMEIL